MRTKDLYLEHPAITRALRTGYGYGDWTQDICMNCGEPISDDDYDAAPIGEGCLCGECWRERLEEEGFDRG